MLLPLRQKKAANMHLISYRGEPFLMIDNCRYGTKLAFNCNADLMLIMNPNKKNTARIAPCYGAIWDEFSEHRKHQSKKKSTRFRAGLALFLLQIRCKLNAQFDWDLILSSTRIIIK